MVDFAESGDDEILATQLPPENAAALLAARKATAVAARYPGSIVLGADTIVDLDGIALNKPADRAEAERMLRNLRGRTHRVHTALAAAPAHGDLVASVSTSRVRMHEFPDRVLDHYLATGESMDKAGAYGIQGIAGDIVAAVDGCFTNVVGLPFCAAARLLATAGLLVTAPAPECAFRGHDRCPHWPGSESGQA